MQCSSQLRVMWPRLIDTTTLEGEWEYEEEKEEGEEEQKGSNDKTTSCKRSFSVDGIM